MCVSYYPTLSGSSADVKQMIGDQSFGQWLELDLTLVQLWESRSIRPKTLYYSPQGMEEGATERMGCLLPEITRRRIIDLAKWI